MPSSASGGTTNSPVFLRSLLDAGRRAAVDTTAWFQGLGFDADDLDMPGRMVPHHDAVTMLRRALQAIDTPELGLALGMRARITHRGGLALGMAASRTLGEALALTTRFPRSAGNLLLVHHEQSATRHALVAAPHPGEHDVESYLVDKLFAGHIRMCRQITGGPCSPLRVELVRHPPDNGTAHARFFGCPVVFGSLHNRLVSDAAWLDHPLPMVSAFAVRQAVELLEREARLPGGQSDLLSNIERSILKMLPRSARQAEVASSLFLSERSLRRKLAAEGVSFRQLLDGCRKSRALELLFNGQRSAAEAASEAGFADLKTFQRAYRRWQLPPHAGPAGKHPPSSHGLPAGDTELAGEA